jgi:hypothetical protein
MLMLVSVYTNTTGLKPTTSTHAKKTGGFVDFVLAVRDTFGIPLGDDAVFRAVKVAVRDWKNMNEAAQQPSRHHG